MVGWCVVSGVVWVNGGLGGEGGWGGGWVGEGEGGEGGGREGGGGGGGGGVWGGGGGGGGVGGERWKGGRREKEVGVGREMGAWEERWGRGEERTSEERRK